LTAPPPSDASWRLEQVSVITVLHNSGDVIGDCLAALPAEVEVVVVDNASSDGGVETVSRVRPDAIVVRSASNLGFGGGCQLGSEAASRPLLLFLNPDARVTTQEIARLAETLTEHPRSVVGPRLLTAEGERRPIRRELDIRKDALWLLPASGRWFPFRWRLQAERASQAEYEVPFVEGACFLVRAADLRAAGGFDPDLFLYFEETSLAHRLKLRGGSAWYEPRATVTHVGETSTGKNSELAAFHFHRSRVILERKVLGDLSGRLRSAVLLLAAVANFLRAAGLRATGRRPGATREARAILRGTASGIAARIGAPYR
jgi:N-acetylglucosaminyl-diphospho-decaprenol L-rhamnosyltransferase